MAVGNPRLAYVVAAILLCAVGWLLVRYAREIADWQEQMHEGARRATSGWEQKLWTHAASPFSHTDATETICTLLGGGFVVGGCALLLVFIFWSVWRSIF